MPAVLFCCTHNRCRSRIAEALARELFPHWTILSAGSAPEGGVHPDALRTLLEVGLTSSGPGRRIDDLPLAEFDLIVTLCDDEETCPRLAAVRERVLHKPFEDPSRLPADTSAGIRAEAFRHLRERLKAFCLELPELIEEKRAARR